MTGKAERETVQAGYRLTEVDIPKVKAGEGGDLGSILAGRTSVVVLKDLDIKTPRPLPDEVRRLLQD